MPVEFLKRFKMRHRVFVYFLLIFVAVSLVGGSVLSTYNQFVSEGPLTEQREILIQSGESLRKIAHRLHQEGIISSPTVFELGVRAMGHGTGIQVGEYAIPRHASMKLVATLLTSGQTYVRRLAAALTEQPEVSLHIAAALHKSAATEPGVHSLSAEHAEDDLRQLLRNLRPDIV
jgi:cell division protein YceG involved in septum cleavage